MIRIFILLTVSFLTSCQTKPPVDKDLFKQSQFYKNFTDEVNESVSLTEEKTAKVSFRGQTLTDFSIWFSNYFTKGIVFDESLRDKEITAEFVNASESEIINLVSKMFNLDANKLGSTYYIGKFRQEDRGILVRHISGLTREDISGLIASVSATQGRSHVTDSGVVVIADRESVLARINILFDSLGAIDIKRYAVNFYFIDLNVSELEQKGVDLTTSGTFSAVLANNIPSIENGANLISRFNISAFVEYLNSNSFGKLVSTPLFVCYDNVKSNITRGEVLPYPKRIVSPEGTVTTDYENVNIGETLDCLVRSAGTNKVLLNLDYSNSDLIELINDEIPRTSNSKFSTSTILETNKLYLLGEMVSNDQRESDKTFYYKNEHKINKTQIFVKVIRI